MSQSWCQRKQTNKSKNHLQCIEYHLFKHHIHEITCSLSFSPPESPSSLSFTVVLNLLLLDISYAILADQPVANQDITNIPFETIKSPIQIYTLTMWNPNWLKKWCQNVEYIFLIHISFEWIHIFRPPVYLLRTNHKC